MPQDKIFFLTELLATVNLLLFLLQPACRCCRWTEATSAGALVEAAKPRGPAHGCGRGLRFGP